MIEWSSIEYYGQHSYISGNAEDGLWNFNITIKSFSQNNMLVVKVVKFNTIDDFIETENFDENTYDLGKTVNKYIKYCNDFLKSIKRQDIIDGLLEKMDKID
jgi:hypothetical protein